MIALQLVRLSGDWIVKSPFLIFWFRVVMGGLLTSQVISIC